MSGLPPTAAEERMVCEVGDGPTAEVTQRQMIASTTMMVRAIGPYLWESMDSVTCLVDQRLDLRQYAGNNSFGPRRIWLEVADLLKRRIAYKRIIKYRVE
jgi:hypothetical protein